MGNPGNRLRATFVLVFAVAFSLTACEGSPGEVVTDYEGFGSNMVASCVGIASDGDLRSDPAVPASVRVEDVSVDSSHVGPGDPTTWLVSGRTVARFDDGPQAYAWDCEVTVSVADRTLTAELTRFEAEV
jgi:hypothetical protein